MQSFSLILCSASFINDLSKSEARRVTMELLSFAQIIQIIFPWMKFLG